MFEPSSRSRRAFLGLLAAAGPAAAGCSSVSSSRGAAVSPPECDRAVDELPRPRSPGGAVSPRSYPTPPDEWTREATRTFGLALERAYVINRTLVDAGRLTYVEFAAEAATLVDAPSGYVIRTSVQFAYGAPSQEGEGTPITVHADYPYEVALYLTPHGVVRAESADGVEGTPAVDDEGRVLLCQPRGTIHPRTAEAT